MKKNGDSIRRFQRLFLALISVSLLIASSGCGLASDLARVPTRYVCMVNDMFFGKDQIPVKIEDRTYYGCCEACEKTIRESAKIRAAIDPVSGRPVDGPRRGALVISVNAATY